jgi:hypothetical protein
MSGTDVTLTDLLEQQLAATLEAMAGPAYGVVETYDPATERASVSPLVPLRVDGDVVASPKLPSVPVVWPRSTTHSDKWPLVDAAGVGNGSLVELAPLGHDHSQWMTSGAPNITPTSERRFSLADLVAKPLSPSPLATPPNPLSYDAAYRVLFGQMKFGDNTATKPVGLNGDAVNKVNLPTPDSMALWMSQVEAAINVLAPGSITPLSTTFTKVGAITATGTDLLGK